MKPVRHRLVLAAFAATVLVGCGQSATETAVLPLEINQGTSCSLDGMLLADYPGPKAQIHYAGQAEPDYFCDTVEMFHMFLNPEQVRVVRGIFVQDMGKADSGPAARPLDRREDRLLRSWKQTARLHGADDRQFRA